MIYIAKRENALMGAFLSYEEADEYKDEMINEFHDHCCLCSGCRDLYEHQRNFPAWHIASFEFDDYENVDEFLFLVYKNKKFRSIHSSYEEASNYRDKKVEKNHDHCCLCVNCENSISDYHSHNSDITRWEIKICKFGENKDDYYVYREDGELLDNKI